jgi:hypothetical protein
VSGLTEQKETEVRTNLVEVEEGGVKEGTSGARGANVSTRDRSQTNGRCLLYHALSTNLHIYSCISI